MTCSWGVDALLRWRQYREDEHVGTLREASSHGTCDHGDASTPRNARADMSRFRSPSPLKPDALAVPHHAARACGRPLGAVGRRRRGHRKITALSAHDDRNASLSVADLDTGPDLGPCHAACAASRSTALPGAGTGTGPGGNC